MTNNKTSASTKFYMKQANEIVDVLSEIIPTIYYDVFKDHFDIFMDKLWVKPDEKNPPILDRLMLPPGANVRTLEQTNWNALPEDKKREWLKRMDLQALLKALAFRPKSLNLFCEKNSLKKEKMESVLHPMINWRNYGVGHKSVYKYEQMSEKDFKQIILEPVWDFTDLLSRHYAKECEIIRKKLHIIEMRMKLPDTSVQRLVELSGKPESTVREVLSILKIETAQDGTIIGEDEKELVDNIKRLSEKESIQQKEKEENEEPSNLLSKIKNRDKKTIGLLSGALFLLLLLVIILLSQCGNGGAVKKKSEKKTTVEETTTDNRQVVDPFKYMYVKEKESDDDSYYYNEEDDETEVDSNYLPVDIKILNDKQNEIQYDVVECYDNEANFEADKSQWDNDILLANEEKKTEDVTNEYGESLDEDYLKHRNHGQILIIQVKQVTVNNHPDIKYAGSDGKTYYKYVVKGVERIRTESHLDTINKKSLKTAEKKGKSAIVDIAKGREDDKLSNIKMIGYYVSLPPETKVEDNEGTIEANVYLIYKLHVIDSFWSEEIRNKDCYCCYILEDPIYNSKKKAICARDGSYGKIMTSQLGNPDFDKYSLFTSIKELYNTFINEDVVEYGNDIYPKPYGNNKIIKRY